MLKKILFGAFLLVIIAVLAIGAIIRTNEKVVGTSGNGRGKDWAINHTSPKRVLLSG